jgi:hypothetical protein
MDTHNTSFKKQTSCIAFQIMHVAIATPFHHYGFIHYIQLEMIPLGME